MGFRADRAMVENMGVTRAMYLDKIAEHIRFHIPADRMPDENTKDLLLLYAVLLRAKGPDVRKVISMTLGRHG